MDDDKRTADTLWPMRQMDAASVVGNGSSDPENTSNRRTRRDKEITTELRGNVTVWLMIAAAVSPKEDAKGEHVRKCKLRFPNVSTEVFTEWRDKKRSIWPCPKGGFKDAAVTVFWDIENCVPDTEFGSSPGAYASMFRTAFETTTGARIMTCIASLSDTYPVESGPLSYEKLLSLNALDDAWYVLTAAGKASKKVHKDYKEADNVLKSKMQGCLRVCKPEDVVVIISGDGG
ncbi:hypothetical protein QJQ45_023903 [Haematococcus lacustris]|nr:hypothetical protein QJQ45_023903 [Haematococcus lacustris]